ncbi:hypothetical protein [Streptomyces cavernae]|uniref:hypothetical protein n=1 Tax=Streptomyces cavernae TaxID=2259034 RepID=UPI001EE4086B|nr:hypothetical protein [Streptomyces cavernae]
MVRRPVAWLTAAVLLVEAVGFVLVNWFLGVVVDRQDMSLAGLDPNAMAIGSWVAGALFGVYLGFCAFVAARVAVRDRPAAGLGRIVLISAAVVHGLLGAFTVGLVGWGAFLFMMVVLGLIVLTLMTYDADARKEPTDAVPASGDGDGGAPVTPPTPTTT